MPGVGDGPFDDGWVSPLNRAIYPPPGARRTPLPAPGLGPVVFGLDTVVERPENDPARPDTVCPGAHRLESPDGAYDVVWWDPSRLNLGVEARFGLRREELIAKDVAPHVVDARLREYREWEQWRDEAVEQGSVPSIVVRTAGEWAESGERLPDGFELPRVELLTLPRVQPTPSGRRFGTLVHLLLSTAALGDTKDVAELAAVEARLLGAPSDEAAAAAALAVGVLGHAVLRDAAAAHDLGRCLREAPVTFHCSDGSLIEGVVDLAFEREGRWVVVDFKTDVEIDDEGLERYRRQVGFYAAAIARATGKPAEGVLLRI